MRRRDTMDSEACGSGNESLSISRQSSQQMLVSTPNFPIDNSECNQQIPFAASSSVDQTGTTRSRRRQFTNTPYMEKLEKMLDVSKFIEQVERYIDMPIKIPSNMTVNAGLSREKPLPGKAKRDLFSVEDIWGSPAERKAEISTLFNTDSVGERKWLIDLLTEESDPDSGGEEEFTDEDIRTMLKIHRERRKFQKKYHSDPLNLQYTYYGAGLISEHDRFPEHQANVVKRMNLTQK